MRRRTIAFALMALTLVTLLGGYALWRTLPTRQQRLDAALIDAVWQGQAPEVASLLNDGANPDALCIPPLPPIRRPGLQGLFQSLRYRHEKHPWPTGKTALWVATLRRRPDIISLLIRHGAHINGYADQAFADGATMLMLEIQDGNFPMTQVLLDNGADVNTKNLAGETALMWAARRGQTAIVPLLLHKGADASPHNAEGKTALSYAEAGGYSQIVRLLKQAGATK